MDAAMAHRERKQLNFSTIVDFSLSKQGIFFITLTHKKLFHRLVKELFVFHGVTGFEQPALATVGHKQSSGLFARVRENPRPFAA